jgi:hypothetical protein
MKRRLDLDAVGAVVAATAALVLAFRAINHFDDSWDGTSYHLVFAAFRSGILAPADFTPIPLLGETYKGFPPLLDVIRGYTWRITGSILVLQLFNLLAILALTAFWKFRFRLAAQWALIAILSVPLLQIGATSLYVDTLTNCLFAIPLSALSAAFIERRSLNRPELVVSLIALAVATNVKLQFVVLGAALFAVLCGYQAYCLAREGQRRELKFLAGLAVVAACAVGFTAWRNLIVLGNPVYPMTATILGYRLPGMLPLYFSMGPEYLDGAPQSVKWLLSILEFRAFEGRDLAYTIDQHATIPIGFMPAVDPRPPSFRMGGYFVPLVLGLLAWLAILTRDRPLRDRLRWFVPPVVTAAIVAPLPASNELRYFSFWVVNLIFLCLLAAHRAPADRVPFQSFLMVMFLSVGMLTGWRYFDFRPYSVQDHIVANGFDNAITGHNLCFEHRNRDPILFTHIFYSKGWYRVVDLAPGERCSRP